MKLSLFLASTLLALLALEQVDAHDANDANETDKIPPGVKFVREKIPKNRRLKYMKKENPAEMRKMMKEKGLIDISEEKGLVRLITAKDGSNVPNQYIAHLKPCGKYGKIRKILKGRGSQQRVKFNNKDSYVILRNISASDLQKLRQLTDVFVEIEQDKKMSLGRSHCEGYFRADKTWNLDRIDYYYWDDDRFATWALGFGIDAYVMDTGINPYHSDFGGRVSSGWHASRFSNSRDYDGHGTHVASTLGGKTYGVAKEVNIIPVKVCVDHTTCYYSDIVEGLYWIKSQVQRYKRLSVVNMSLGGSYTSYINNAVYAVLNAGIPVVVSAGNDDQENACYKSPASVRWALTVGATDEDDYVASFSNIGHCVDIYAPGTKIRAAYYANNYGTTVYQGTSMASPLVAGAVAGMVQVFRDAGYYRVPTVSLVDDINYYIIKFAEKGTVRGLPSTNNNNVMLQTMCLTT
ncbi:proteinase T-like [Lingula anatina]|uniref:Proteinase T-like n=1 Tax=Lingula anatina TaxID=7574 RepID=A0A1S3IDE7_LINAN|nr:proteinase T-like [Lingula anatina]|eukprot:XP_013396262.1 proteinase T-like [Lingula anatina]